ncbi:amidase [Nocardia farcinica]|uniref:amidase n=1 Tax=Nocardia farcinica TaxID=37329 RepID=UPI001893CFAB|nr:amidase [Nocardia farcinica]MBF6252338.1 Asp-tRNA(Asn)/Glu-tRNA(Gln) amidotransferase subunit GatA [Nocardia farcinica]
MRPCDLTLSEASEEIAAGRLSPVELTESVLDQVARHEPVIGAFSVVTAEAATMQAARAAEEIAAGRRRGPLHGIPIGVKALVNRAGVETTSSSRSRAGHVPEDDAAVVERLDRAGAVLVGQTHTHEFAYGVVTPTTRNPWHPDHIPGGSSGGSGAALAARMVLGAIGTDTGGSIRIPSALCGVTGIKPTYGRVSRYGTTSLSWSLDHIGPMGRTVADKALLLGELAGFDPRDPATVDAEVPDYRASLVADVRGMTVGVPTNYFFDHIDPEVEAAYRAAVHVLADAGAHVREVALPLPEQYMPVEYAVFVAEASAYHQEALRERADRYEADVRLMLEAGEMVLATDYIRALRARTLLQQGWREMFDGLDAVLAPTVPRAAAPAGQGEFTWPDGMSEPLINAYVRTCAPGNLTGLPAMSVPCGFTATGLPIGMQIIGKPFDEATVLRVGHTYESATDWTRRAPDLIADVSEAGV